MNTSKLVINHGNPGFSHRIGALGWGVILILLISGCASADPYARFEIIPASGEVPLNVTFVDQSAVNATGWNWTVFDEDGITPLYNNNYTITNGFTNNATVPMYRFEQPGRYPVTLVAYNETDPTKNETFRDAVMVTAPVLTAAFTPTFTNGTAPLNVSFIDQSTGNVTGWNWTVNGTPLSTERNPEYRFEENGTYTVRLNVTNTFYEVSNEAFRNISVGDPVYPVIKFATTPQNGTVPLNVTFIDQSDLDPEILDAFWYFYDFGDGATLTNTTRNVEHTYNRTGTFYPNLTLTSKTDPDRVVYATATVPVIVYNSTAVANFTAASRNGSAPLNVSFIDQSYSEVPIVSWLWDFGDGTSSTEQNPEHRYLSVRNYTVNLTVQDANGISDIEVKDAYVNAGNVTAPVADFIPVPAEGQAPLNVSFFDNSAGNITSWAWEFGDGDTSAELDPVHRYENASIYRVNLTVTDYDGQVNTSSANVTVLPKELPQAAFTWGPRNESSILNVSFIDQSVINPAWFPYVTYEWDFGDLNTSTDKNPTHRYAKGGTYDVSMWINLGEYGNSTCSDVVNRTVLPPVASFVAAPRSGPQPLTVSFIDTSVAEAGLIAWDWDFGDSTPNSTEQNPHHIYDRLESFNVTLTVTDSIGQMSSVLNPGMINVTESEQSLRAGFSAIPAFGNPPMRVSFTDTSEFVGDITRTWKIGNEIFSHDVNPVYNFTEQGEYEVNLTISDGIRQSSNTTTVSVWPLKADFVATPTGRSVSFQDTSMGFPQKWFWTFGDGYTSQVQNPTHEYVNAGEYQAALYIQNVENKHATIKKVTVS